MQIFVRNLYGPNLTLRVNPHDTVRRIKEQIETVEAIKPALQKLAFNGWLLEDNRLLSYYTIKDSSTIDMI